MQVLFQLSYSPGKLKIYRKIETGSLSILGRRYAQLDTASPDYERARQKVAAV